MRTILLIALAQASSLVAFCDLRAQAPVNTAGVAQAGERPNVVKPLTREDADLMLREAHSAIEQGRLADAEKIITRVENAHVQFPFIHTGPTPASLRKELARAERLRSASKALAHDEPMGAKKYLPFSRGNNSPAVVKPDPFAGRGRNVDPIAAPTSSPASTSTTNDRLSQNNPYAGLTGKPAGLTATNGELSVPNYPRASNESMSPAARSASDSLATTAKDTDAVGLAPQKSQTAASPKQQAQEELAAARKALASGDIDLAEKLTQTANALGVPESQYLPDEDRPSLVAWDIARAKQKQNHPQSAKPTTPPATQMAKDAPAQPGVSRLPAPTTAAASASRYESQPASRYEALADSRYAVQPAQATEPVDAPKSPAADSAPSAYRVIENSAQLPAITPLPPEPAQAAPQVPAAQVTNPTASNESRATEGPLMVASKPGSLAGDRLVGSELAVTGAPSDDLPLPASGGAAAFPGARANELPKQEPPVAFPPVPAPQAPPVALPSSNELPPPAQDQPVADPPRKSLIDSADEAQKIVLRKLDAEVLKRQSEAVRLREKDPERSLAILRETQQMINESKLPESTRRELLGRLDKTLHDTQDFMKGHGAQIDLDKRNEAILADVEHDREMKLKLQQKIAEMVEEFNRLNHEQRFSEAEIVARRLNEMAPNDPVAKQVWMNAKFIRREMMNRQTADAKEDSFWKQLNSVEEAAINPVAENGKELVYDQKSWKGFIANRKGSQDRAKRRTERELEIERRLQTPVLLKYQETPLTEVVGNLSELTGVNMHLDPRGLSQEGINTDVPVTINLSKEISLKSALNLVLDPLHLKYVVSDEVLKITSEQLADGKLERVVYNVADLVTPIPNFTPSSGMGLQGLINDSMQAASAGRGPYGFGGNGPGVLVNDRAKRPAASPNGGVFAQQMDAGSSTNASGAPTPTVPIGSGPGGMGGAANADFDSLIDLIVSTVSTDTWAENGGGQAEIRPFPTNLSLVVSQTQAVHEQIADLLQQLRRLQDLQVTIEVRFIRLNDSFFERIGIDFNANVKDIGVTPNNIDDFRPSNQQGHTNTVGVQKQTSGSFPTFTSDLSIPFTQNSFASTALPPFGGVPTGGLNFGFAILSDIEAYFLIEAAQGDRRVNVLNAPKITLFNGQQAFVADATQRPFVVGVIPVVGEFASAQQPVIVVLNEGTMMTIQAVVSDDRRYVRMTIVPFFTQIGNVDTFTFEGSSSSTSASSSSDNDDDGSSEKKDEKGETKSGVTVQLPSFSFISVVTTVSVPDGGTVLLGGIKRLSEGRNEFGVPLLSKVPYINRLFKNVAIGRETDSIMMMVTPRIIIQEEEEERLGIAAP